MSDEVKNYITPGGYRRLQEELARLWKVERPPIVTTVTWAAGNGDRSENGDYIYGKRKLREIDRRIRYLSKSLDRATVVDNSGKTHERVHFGATVTIQYESGDERDVTIVGRRRARLRRRSRLLALSAGQGAADGKGRRHGDASRAARPRAPRDHRGSLRRPALAFSAAVALDNRRGSLGACGRYSPRCNARRRRTRLRALGGGCPRQPPRQPGACGASPGA